MHKNMRRLNLIGMCVLAFAGLIQASPLTPQQALERMNDGRVKITGTARLESVPVYTARTADGVATAYVFNATDGNGFRILSADDAAYAVLGYSDTGSIDAANMSPELQWWLERLGAQMEYYISQGATTGEMTPRYAPMAAIAPQTKSKWNQDAPYYNDCPTLNGKTCYTGCVATSMAQVMYYHKFPEKGTGSNTYYWDKGDRNLSMDFSAQAFDWNNMLDEYNRNQYNDTQAAAVAFLMKSCGYSVDMGYGTDASGTQGCIISNALKEYFGYDGNINVKWRTTFSATEWAETIYNNLKNCGPVILNGHPYQEAGHSFICDGYNGDGYFHFNWGWGGVSDGWYLLECMNPESQGIGGASQGSAFNYGLNGIFGICKPTGNPVETQYGNLLMYGSCTAVFENQNGNEFIEFSRTSYYPDGWYCASDRTVSLQMGIIVEPVDGTAGETIDKGGLFNGSTRVSLSPGYVFTTTAGPRAIFPENLAEGRYKVTIATRDRNIDNAPYIPVLCPYGSANYVYVTIKDGEKSIENVPTPVLQPKSLTLESNLFYSRYAQYKVKVNNPSEYELTEVLSPALLQNGKIVMVGGVAPLTCNPNTETEVVWDARMILVNGASRPTSATQYTLAVVNPVTNEILGTYGEVTMSPDPGKATLRTTKLEIANCTAADETLESGSTISVYDIADSSFTADLDFTVWSGYFDGVINGAIYRINPANQNEQEFVQDVYSERKFMYEDDKASLAVPVEFKGGGHDILYALQFTYTSGNDTRSMRSVYFRTHAYSGVADVAVEENESVRYYNMQGMEITTPVKGQIVIVKKGNTTKKVRF